MAPLGANEGAGEMGGIFLIQADGKLVEMKAELYKSEDVSQSILANCTSS